jgi:hypothetical protein
MMRDVHQLSMMQTKTRASTVALSVYEAKRMCSVKIIFLMFHKELTGNLKFLALFLALVKSNSQLNFNFVFCVRKQELL